MSINKLNKPVLLRCIIFWGPVILQMGLIFFFSAQPSGSSVLKEFPVPAGLGHFVGYALLGFLIYRGFGQGSFRWQSGTALKTIIVALLYAISDELHQLFVPGRQASLADIVVDLFGVLAALLVIYRLKVKA